ncbi:M-phase phosphoprotein 8 isoform X2 [Osmerus mordax]|uniref:M-phase phosphoprotein 8 isoform X2 n=1 Tax=Osmerus mordax TaxID=8014 RepID=UPI00350EDAD3
MTSGAEKTDLGDSEQDEENVYEVERIIDVRTEEGEVLYRVRWKNYASDDDTWEPEAHLDDCREVLLAYKRALAEAEAKKGILPMKSDVFDADSSESDKERPTETPTKKKKKKKRPEDEEVEEESASKEKRKKKKEKRKEDIRPRPAPESDEEDERAPSPPAPSAHKDKPTDAKKRLVDSEDEDEVPVPSKKHRKSKTKEGGKHRKERSEEGRQRKGGKKERRHQVETSEEEGTAPLEEDLSDEPSESQTDDPTGKSSERGRADDMPKKKTGKSELKLQGIKDFLHDKRSKKPDTPSPTLSQRENKLKILSSSRSRDEAVPLSSDSSDSSSRHKKAKSKGAESATVPPKVPSSASSTSSSSSIAAASTSKAREEEPREDAPKEKEQSASTNLFEKFLLNCEAKDRVPRRQAVHQPSPAEAGKAPKLIGKIEKRAKSAKESPARRSEEKTEKPRHTEDDKMEVEADTLGDRRGEVPAQRLKVGEDSRERRERQEEGPRGGERWERRNPSFEAADKRKKREDSEPRLFIACDDNQDPQDSLESAEKSDKAPATLSLGMDLNLDWMTLDEFQKHLNGEDEILSAPPLSPSELRDAVKSGDYMSVKLALNSKEDYNLDQEDSSGMSLCMLAAAGGQDDILRLLIKKGVKMNGRQKNGTTALMHAAEKNFLTTVAILLEAGSFVNAQTLGGETALMKACKRGNADVVRLLLEYGADCNITSKHKNTAMYFAKVSNNIMVFDLIKDHIQMLSSVAEDTIRAYFESRLALLEPVFPLACHRLCEGPDFSLEFGYKPPSHTPAEGSGILLFIFHANFLSEISARLCGPCSVHAVVLNDKFQLPIFLDSHFIYSFSPVPGINKLFVRLAESPTAKVKLLICAYRVQLQ